MSGSTDTMARRVFEAIGRGPLFDDPRFATNAARLTNDKELDGMVADFIAGLPQAQCLAVFRSHGVTVGPIYAPSQLMADPHVAQRGVYVRVDSGDGSAPTVMHQVTPRLQGTPGSIRSTAPRRGQHTEELLRELGDLQPRAAEPCTFLQSPAIHLRVDLARLAAHGVVEVVLALGVLARIAHLLPRHALPPCPATVPPCPATVPPRRAGRLFAACCVVARQKSPGWGWDLGR
jgi:hypothetical protein